MLALTWLNEAGLILAMVGARLIFFWELGDMPGARRRRYQRLARFGVLLIIVGFAFQARAVLPLWQPPPSPPS